jgi:hypothetical protein
MAGVSAIPNQVIARVNIYVEESVADIAGGTFLPEGAWRMVWEALAAANEFSFGEVLW